jgi:response regulator of citrate/malate metabolism
VGCSGYDDIEEKNLALRSGMIDYLVKPINIKQLE